MAEVGGAGRDNAGLPEREPRPVKQRQRNDRFRAARLSVPSPKWDGEGLSRQELADAVNTYLWDKEGRPGALDAHYIAKIERGDVACPRQHYRTAFRAVLKVASDTDLGFHPSARGGTHQLLNQSVETPESAFDSVKSTDVDRQDIYSRRSFIGSSAGALLGFSVAAHPRLRFTVGDSDVRYLLDRTARLRRLDNYLGGRETYQVYVSELNSTTDYLLNSSATLNTKAKLLGVVAEQAQLAGWAAFDAGMQAEARTHYQDSLSAAAEAGNTALKGNALAFLAYQEVSTNSPNVALAEASFEIARRDATPKVRALLLERKALTYAAMNDRRSTEVALSGARMALHESANYAEPDWVFWIDDIELDIVTGRCWTELGRPAHAIAVLDEALARFDNTHARDKALYSTSLAHALIDNDEIERSAAVTMDCIRLADGVASVRPGMRVNSVIHRLRKHRSLPEVSQVFEMVLS